jgi:hypothetical protein
LVSARWAGQWSRPIEGSFFEVEVGELARDLDALVAGPKRDYAGVDAGFQEPHGGGVSQYVCGDSLFADARALTGGDASIVGDAVFDKVTG